jgi:hypothetical protein
MSSSLAHAQHQARAWAGRVSAAVSGKAAEPDDHAPPDARPSESDRSSSRSSASTIESDGFHRLPAVASTSGRYTHIGVPDTRERGRIKQSGAAEPGLVGSASSPGSSAYTGELEPGCRTPGISDRPLVSQPPSELPPSDSPARPAAVDARLAASDARAQADSAPTPPPPPPPPQPQPPSEPRVQPRRSTSELLAELRAAVSQVFDEAQAQAQAQA